MREGGHGKHIWMDEKRREEEKAKEIKEHKERMK